MTYKTKKAELLKRFENENLRFSVIEMFSQVMDALARDVVEAGRVEMKECKNHGNSEDDNFEAIECYGYDEMYNSAVAASQEKLRAYGVPLAGNKEKV